MGVYGAEMNLERGTGFEPATACLEGRRPISNLDTPQFTLLVAPQTVTIRRTIQGCPARILSLPLLLVKTYLDQYGIMPLR